MFCITCCVSCSIETRTCCVITCTYQLMILAVRRLCTVGTPRVKPRLNNSGSHKGAVLMAAEPAAAKPS